MQNEMKGYVEPKSFNDKKREEGSIQDVHTKHVEAAIKKKNTMAVMTPAWIGKMQAYDYARSMYLMGMSGDKCL